MKNTFFISSLFFILGFNISIAQSYDTYVQEAEKLYEQKDYKKSAEAYSKAFSTNNWLAYPTDRYNAACSWALAGQKDSSFFNLFRLANKANYSNLNHLTTDTDLVTLHSDSRWKELYEIVKKNKDKEEANLDKPLVAILDTVYQDDQKYRHQIDSIEKKFGWKSPEMTAHWKIINEKDSINLLKVTKILDERGWLGSDIIGNNGNSTLFLVIQHSDIKVQEKYLPMMREAVAQKRANASSLALLEDRVALRQGKKQIYGSQIGRNPDTGEHYVQPLEDPDNVNKRRASMGLGTIEAYISHWNMKWDVEDYKKRLPEFEALQKK